MKRLRVLVMLHPQLQPPDSLDGCSEQQIDEWRVEFDVIAALRAAGHQVRVQPVLDSLTELDDALRLWHPHIVFNLLEEFDGQVAHEPHLVAHLELLRQRYTGCNPRGLMLARDKVLAKQLLRGAGIATPDVARRAARRPAAAAAVAAFPVDREVRHRRRVAGHRAGVGGAESCAAARARAS